MKAAAVVVVVLAYMLLAVVGTLGLFCQRTPVSAPDPISPALRMDLNHGRP